MTPSRNTRSYTLRSVPSSPGRSFLLSTLSSSSSRSFPLFISTYCRAGSTLSILSCEVIYHFLPWAMSLLYDQAGSTLSMLSEEESVWTAGWWNTLQLYTLEPTFPLLHSPFYTPVTSLYFAFTPLVLHCTEHYTHSTLLCTLYIVHCTLYTAHCTRYIHRFTTQLHTLPTAHWMLNTKHMALQANSALYVEKVMWTVKCWDIIRMHSGQKLEVFGEKL